MQLPHNLRLIRLLAGITLLSPAVLLLVGIHLYAVDVPFRDSLPYTFLIMEKVFLTHTATLQDFLQPYSEHIMLVPLSVITGLAALTEWNIRIEIFLIGMLAIADAAMVIRLLKTPLREHPVVRYALALLIVVLLCSPIHWETWTLSIVLTYSIVSTVFLGAVSLLSGNRATAMRLIGAGLLCVIGSYSCPHGLLSLLALSVMMLLKKRTRVAAAYGVLFVLIVWMQRPLVPQVLALKSNYTFVFDQPAAFFRHFFTLLGAPYFPDTTQTHVALLIGITIITVFVACGIAWFGSSKEQKNALIPWIGLLIFFLGSSVLISLGRGVYGLGGAYVSRYFAVTQYPGLIALVLLAVLLPRTQKLVVCICIIAIGFNGVFSRRDRILWERTSILQMQAKSCLESYTTATDTCLDWLYPWDIPMDHLPRTAAPLLENMKFLDVFRIPSDATFIESPDHPYGALETIGATPALPELSGTGTIVSGWVMLDDCNTPEHVILTSGKNHTMIAHTTAHLHREDIAKQFGRCHRNAGWEVELRKNTPTRGIAAWVFDSSTRRFLRLKESPTQ